MNANTHPIELFIASLINLIEFTCYIINEIAGHHPSPLARSLQEEITRSPSDLGSDTTIDTASVHSLTTDNTDYIEYIYSLTIKQLQQLTGIRSSRYRKADLQLLAIS